MSSILTNWKTSSAGLAAILVAIADLIHPGATSPGFQADIMVIILGIQGLVAQDAHK